MAEKPWWQVCEAAGHIPSTVGKQTETLMPSLLLSLVESGILVHGMVPPMFRVGLPSTAIHFQKGLHTYAQRLGLGLGYLNSVGLTMKISHHRRGYGSSHRLLPKWYLRGLARWLNQWLRALAPLAEDLSSVPASHCNPSMKGSKMLFWSPQTCACLCTQALMHTCMFIHMCTHVCACAYTHT